MTLPQIRRHYRGDIKRHDLTLSTRGIPLSSLSVAIARCETFLASLAQECDRSGRHTHLPNSVILDGQQDSRPSTVFDPNEQMQELHEGAQNLEGSVVYT